MIRGNQKRIDGAQTSHGFVDDLHEVRVSCQDESEQDCRGEAIGLKHIHTRNCPTSLTSKTMNLLIHHTNREEPRVSSGSLGREWRTGPLALGRLEGWEDHGLGRHVCAARAVLLGLKCLLQRHGVGRHADGDLPVPAQPRIPSNVSDLFGQLLIVCFFVCFLEGFPDQVFRKKSGIARKGGPHWHL